VRLPPTTKPENPKRRFALPSRLIPGAQASAGNAPRKKSSSATVDGRFWDWQKSEGLKELRKRPRTELLAEALFPTLWPHGQRGSVTRQASADFFLIIFSFAAVGHVSVMLQFAIRHDPATLLRLAYFQPLDQEFSCSTELCLSYSGSSSVCITRKPFTHHGANG